MHDLSDLATIGATVLQVALVLAIPVVIAEFSWAGLRLLAPVGYFQIPVLVGAAKLLGIALGILLLSSRYGREHFDLHEIFVPESPWNLSLRSFLAERANPLDYAIALVRQIGGEPAGEPFMFGLGLSGFLLLAVVALPFLYWSPPSAGRAIACGLLNAVMVAYLTVYLICVLMWTLFLLNFWTFAVVAVAFQYYRNRT
jgi:hypothetical protein